MRVQPVGRGLGVIHFEQFQNIHSRTTLLAKLIARPVRCAAFLADTGERGATFAAEALLLGMIGIATGANMPVQYKLALAGSTGHVTAVLPNINRV
ncbi:MAG: hypothetical protein BroJett015_29630 [Chloroflexota bacterium]|nr:MAG: hypothetical protein BroJett015_29630 [Chloroflexota bacterium]